MIPATLTLYARVDPASLLDHELRRAILRAAHRQPGIRVAQLAREHGVDPKTIAHHARLLARAGHLQPDTRGLFARGANAVPAPTPRALLVLRALAAGCGTPTTLARALGVPRGTAGSLLDRLAREGLAQRGPEGFRLAPHARAFLPDQALSPGASLGET